MKKINLLFVFCGGGPRIKCGSSPIYASHFWCSDLPTCANFALQKTASDNQAEYPEAASAKVQKFYMDD